VLDVLLREIIEGRMNGTKVSRGRKTAYAE